MSSSLTEQDVLEILKLLEESSFDLLQLEYGDLKLTVSKNGNIVSRAPAASQDDIPSRAKARSDAAAAGTDRSRAAPQTERAPGVKVGQPVPTAEEEGLVAVKAPVVGTFYVSPEPGAPPFVTVGSSIDQDTTMGLIEVMKVFNAVNAGVKGVVMKILVENAQFVEYGQPLFLVQPD